jgi:hypothetical protein
LALVREHGNFWRIHGGINGGWGMTLPIAVIESRWDGGLGSLNPVSVRTFFELLGALYEANPGSYHYEMF